MTTRIKSIRYLLATDEALRKRAPTGGRFTFHYNEVAEWIDCSGPTASSVLVSLSRIAGSGLTATGNGNYEFRALVNYPKELSDLKRDYRQQLREKSSPSADREQVRQPVIDYVLKLRPSSIVTLDSVEEALSLPRASISSALRIIKRSGLLKERPDLGRAVYETVPQYDKEEPKAVSNGTVPEVKAVQPEPKLVPTPKEVFELKNETVIGRSYREVGKTSSGTTMVQGPDGTVYQLLDL